MPQFYFYLNLKVMFKDWGVLNYSGKNNLYYIDSSDIESNVHSKSLNI